VLDAGCASGPLHGRLSPPGDKSISHRALILSALAEGRSTINGLLQSADVQATQTALEQLGVDFTGTGSSLEVAGLGPAGLQAPVAALDMGNSGTAMRLLSGVLAAQPFESQLIGDDSLSTRPMGRIFRPLRAMGARISGTVDDTAPVHISGRQLHGIHYVSPVASAQVKSCVLLAGLYASGETRISEPALSRDHTERMLRQFGVLLSAGNTVTGGSKLLAAEISVPADISSAAFLIAAALLVEGSDLLLTNVGLNPSRDGFLRALQAMGAGLLITNRRTFGFEPVGDIRVRYSGRLRGFDLPEAWVPSMVDEVPVFMVLASMAEGVTRIRGASELRVKESDRLAVMGDGLRRLGIDLVDYQDGVDITGTDFLRDETLESAGDHRCAMSFAVLALRAPNGFRILDAEYISTSYPGFVVDMGSLGASMKMTESA
jgi:3-phosphoshikimate 1-carboxyvinyltransferase